VQLCFQPSTPGPLLLLLLLLLLLVVQVPLTGPC
jgi:hypothetical protein